MVLHRRKNVQHFWKNGQEKIRLSNISDCTFNIGFGRIGGMSNISSGWSDIGKKSSNIARDCPTFSKIGSTF
jgi:hypothetical protein